jgi:excisionase family DNA binding protein
VSHAPETMQPPGRRKYMTSKDSAPPDGRLAYSIGEVAQVTGLSRDLLYNEMRAGRLAYLKVGRRRIITRQQLEDFLTVGAA